jgi:phosphatidylserine/phosphatidylglycerophosphate/cardiolipin synthase-like enzyme
MTEAESIQAAPQYQPDQLEVVANGLIARMVEAHGAHMPVPTPDPILERFLELAKHSKRAYFYSLYPAADKRLAAGLGEAVRNGSKVAIITNSYESSRTLSSIPLPYDGGITSMLALAQAGVTVYQWMPTPELSFMHQKMAVVDDTVIFGSHNFNYSSTHGYDQLDLVIHDPKLADLLAHRFEEQAANHTRVATASFLRWQRRRQWLGVQISKWLLGLY